MNIGDIFNFATSLHLFFKLAAIVFSFLYLFYAFVIWRQIPIMNKTLETVGGSILLLIATFQIFIAILIFLLAIFIL